MLPADDSQRQLTVDFVFASVFAFVFVFVFCKVAGTDRSMAGKSGKNYSGRNSTNIPANFLNAGFREKRYSRNRSLLLCPHFRRLTLKIVSEPQNVFKCDRVSCQICRIAHLRNVLLPTVAKQGLCLEYCNCWLGSWMYVDY